MPRWSPYSWRGEEPEWVTIGIAVSAAAAQTGS